MLKVGGLMTYSTCSLNPVEDEAVVCELLRRTRGAVRVVDLHSLPTSGAEGLPAGVAASVRGALDGLGPLRRVRGVAKWRVKCSNSTRRKEEMGGGKGNRDGCCLSHGHPKSCYPPSQGEEGEVQGIEGCMRILPHHGDTGGFFIALLCKVGPIPSSEAGDVHADCGAAAAAAAAEGFDNGGGPEVRGLERERGEGEGGGGERRRSKRGDGRAGKAGGFGKSAISGSQARVIPIGREDAAVANIVETFELGEDFPIGNLMTR